MSTRHACCHVHGGSGARGGGALGCGGGGGSCGEGGGSGAPGGDGSVGGSGGSGSGGGGGGSGGGGMVGGGGGRASEKDSGGAARVTSDARPRLQRNGAIYTAPPCDGRAAGCATGSTKPISRGKAPGSSGPMALAAVVTAAVTASEGLLPSAECSPVAVAWRDMPSAALAWLGLG